MDATIRRAGIEWQNPLPVSRAGFTGPVKIGPFLVGGSGPIHNLPLIDVTRKGLYLTFPEEARPAENEVFRVVRPLGRRADAVLASGRPRKIVAAVKILRVEETTRALVKVLWGSVIKGMGAERITDQYTSPEQSGGSNR